MPGTADLYFYYQGTVYTLENHCLIRLRNSYQSFKYYLNDIDIAFRVLSSSHSILKPYQYYFHHEVLGVSYVILKKLFFERLKEVSFFFSKAIFK